MHRGGRWTPPVHIPRPTTAGEPGLGRHRPFGAESVRPKRRKPPQTPMTSRHSHRLAAAPPGCRASSELGPGRDRPFGAGSTVWGGIGRLGREPPAPNGENRPKRHFTSRRPAPAGRPPARRRPPTRNGGNLPEPAARTRRRPGLTRTATPPRPEDLRGRRTDADTPTHRTGSPPHQATNPAHRPESLPRQATHPTYRPGSPPHRATNSTHRPESRPRRATHPTVRSQSRSRSRRWGRSLRLAERPPWSRRRSMSWPEMRVSARRLIVSRERSAGSSTSEKS